MTLPQQPICKLPVHMLSPVSREYKHVLDTMLKKHATEFADIHPNLSTISKKFLQKIVDMIRHADRTWESSIVDEQSVPIDDRYMAAIKQNHWYDWITPPLQKIIEIDTKFGKQYKLSIHGKTVDIHIIVPHSTATMHPESFSEKRREKYMRNAIRRIIVWLYVAYSFTHEECKNDTSIHLFLTHSKKESLDYDAPLEPQHTNSGASNVCLATGHMLIYRYEEWFKVFIHETFHYLGMEFSQAYEPHSAVLRSIVAEIFPRCLPTTKWLLFETYCETWAEILNVVFLSYYSRKNHAFIPAAIATASSPRPFTRNRGHTAQRHTRRKDRLHDVFVCHNVVSQVETYLQYEQWFSLIQCVKILKHFKLSYSDLFTQEDTVRYDHTERYDLFSYHVLKSIWMYRVNDFIEWCIRTNVYGDDAEVSLDFKKTRDAMMDYVNQMVSHSRDDAMMLGCEQVEQWILNATPAQMTPKHPAVIPIQKSLRMTMFE